VRLIRSGLWNPTHKKGDDHMLTQKAKTHLLPGILAALVAVGLAWGAATKFTDLETTGTMTVGTTLDVTGATTLTGGLTQDGTATLNDDVTLGSAAKLIHTAPSEYVLHFSSSVSIASSYAVIKSSGAAITLSPANSLAILSTTTASAGERFVIRNSSNAVITFQDDGSLSTSGLALGAATRALGINDTLELIFTGTLWAELSFTNNQ